MSSMRVLSRCGGRAVSGVVGSTVSVVWYRSVCMYVVREEQRAGAEGTQREQEQRALSRGKGCRKLWGRAFGSARTSEAQQEKHGHAGGHINTRSAARSMEGGGTQ